MAIRAPDGANKNLHCHRGQNEKNNGVHFDGIPCPVKNTNQEAAFGLQVINSILLKRIVIDDLQLTNTKLAANTHFMKNFARIANAVNVTL